MKHQINEINSFTISLLPLSLPQQYYQCKTYSSTHVQVSCYHVKPQNSSKKNELLIVSLVTITQTVASCPPLFFKILSPPG